MLIGVGLAAAAAAGGVAWYETQHAHSEQLLTAGGGAARLGISLVRMETATASADFACEVAGLPQTATAMASGGAPLAALATADTATGHGQEMLFTGAGGDLLVGAPAPATAVPGAASLVGAALAAPAKCSAGSGAGFFVEAAGTVYGLGVARVESGGHLLGKVVVLTPISAATLNFAAVLLGTAGPSSTVLLSVAGDSYLPGRVAGIHQAPGIPLPAAVRSILHGRQQVGSVTLAGRRYTVAGQPLMGSGGAVVATLVVVQSSVRVGPTVGELAIPLALAVAAVLLLGMVVLVLLMEHYLNRPLRRLNEAVQRLGQNAYADPVNIGGAEEVTRLAANFEIMRRQLRRQLLMATGRTVIASTLTGSAPLAQALNQVLVSMMNLLEADMAMILLPSQQQPGQSVLITNGIPGPALEWSELESSDGILGRLVREPRFLIRSHLAPEERSSLERRIGLRDCLAEPLRAEARALGVLIVANRRRPYQEEDTALCNAVADQVVAAVDKSLQLAATQREATTDAMTGLYNYRFLISYLDQQVNVAERASSPLSVLMLDLDHFKAINDSYGHPVGDRVLRAVASLMLDTIRKSDLAARYGGEEFVVVMSNTGSEDAGLVAEKIRLAVEALVVPLEDDGAVKLSVSLGGVTFPEGTKGARNLLDLADRALYAAKRGGRNRVEFLDLKAGTGHSTRT
ncbi:MAG: GGDEF domain-containing protein [Candidatus Dormibacteria bacterium]